MICRLAEKLQRAKVFTERWRYLQSAGWYFIAWGQRWLHCIARRQVVALHCLGTKVVAEMQNGALRTAVVVRARGVAGKYVINPRRAGQ